MSYHAAEIENFMPNLTITPEMEIQLSPVGVTKCPFPSAVMPIALCRPNFVRVNASNVALYPDATVVRNRFQLEDVIVSEPVVSTNCLHTGQVQEHVY